MGRRVVTINHKADVPELGAALRQLCIHEVTRHRSVGRLLEEGASEGVPLVEAGWATVWEWIAARSWAGVDWFCVGVNMRPPRLWVVKDESEGIAGVGCRAGVGPEGTRRSAVRSA